MNTIKFKLTDEFITIDDKKLYRIEALKDFANVKNGDKGGFVESEANLSQFENCWIYDNAKVYDNARVCGDAKVYENSYICDNAIIRGNAKVYDNVKVYGNAKIDGNVIVYGYAKIFGNAIICGSAIIYGFVNIKGDAKVLSESDYIVFKNWWSSGRYFTWTRSNNMWSVGCFYGTGKELIKKAYNDSELSGREYERVVNYVESILKNSK